MSDDITPKNRQSSNIRREVREVGLNPARHPKLKFENCLERNKPETDTPKNDGNDDIEKPEDAGAWICNNSGK